ncbi:MAG: N-acetylmuramoyl-L-alanine amidase [Alphaproteobacteria bacterium]
MRITERPSPNHNARRAAVDMLLLHYTGMASAAAALARMCDAEAKVSAHYMIEEDGVTWRLVAEENRAWHAGESFWAGERDINSHAIGIELVNPGHEFGYRPFPEAQMEALIDLASDILSRHPIPAARILGHADVAPRRRQDPGELFDWPRLARAGIGLWPEVPQGGNTMSDAEAQEALARFGYETEDLPATLVAFQRHFRPAQINGKLDAETAARLAALVA